MGIIPGFNLTLECAVCKLCYLFGKEFTIEEIKRMMVKPLKGELNKPIDWLG
jgi:L-asparaginase/Glu-tRNA(Gln) amidotransferase subunit D